MDVLLVVYPRKLEDKTLFAIDQFVLKGGRVLMFLDAFSEADVSMDKLTTEVDNYSTPVERRDTGKITRRLGR